MDGPDGGLVVRVRRRLGTRTRGCRCGMWRSCTGKRCSVGSRRPWWPCGWGSPVQPVLGEFVPVDFHNLGVEVRKNKAGGITESWRAESMPSTQKSDGQDGEGLLMASVYAGARTVGVAAAADRG